MTESILFGIIIRCHPELVSGSGLLKDLGEVAGLRLKKAFR